MAKIGEGTFGAWLRTGLNELRNCFFPESNVAQKHTEYGMYGTLTPGEIAETRRDGTRDLEEEHSQPSILDQKLEQAKSRGDRNPERGKERESMVMDR